MISRQTADLFRKGTFQTKMMAGRYWVNVSCSVRNGRVYLSFPFNRTLLDEVKRSFEKRKWEPATKQWSFPITHRNIFQFESLTGLKPGSHWKQEASIIPEVVDYYNERFVPLGATPYDHQFEITSNILRYRHFFAAAHMGLGKTLATLAAMELFAQHLAQAKPGIQPIALWIGPKTPLYAVQNDFVRWQTKIQPWFMTYDRLKSELKTWAYDAPRMVVYDEFSCCKTATSQRTKCCQYVADQMRDHWGLECLIVGLSGTPAPKTPLDWWSEVEIIRPGWITESSPFLLRERLGVTEEKDDGVRPYISLKAWKDGSEVCETCGNTEADHLYETHPYKKANNEVAAFGQRLKGPVGVWLKEDCLSLPPKVFEKIKVTPTTEILALAKSLVKTTTRAADLAIRLRTLSDGFLYEEQVSDVFETCVGCGGAKQLELEPGVMGPCATCSGTGQTAIENRVTKAFDSPKLDAFDLLLDQHVEVGRFVTYAVFHASVDILCERAHQQGWSTIKVDGRGWAFHDVGEASIEQIDMHPRTMLDMFQDIKRTYPKLVFIGNPTSAGMGLTLTESPSVFFYSNDYSPQARDQAIDRVHRIGTKVNKVRVFDVIHLPSDELVLGSLKLSNGLQSLTLDEIKKCYE